jgi:hypothetical protein
MCHSKFLAKGRKKGTQLGEFTMNPLLGFTKEHHAPPRDEEDQKERSSKKVKGHTVETTDHGMGGKDGTEGNTTMETSTIASTSYKESVVGDMLRRDGEEREGIEATVREDLEDDVGMMVEGQIEDKKFGEFECPLFLSMKKKNKGYNNLGSRG